MQHNIWTCAAIIWMAVAWLGTAHCLADKQPVDIAIVDSSDTTSAATNIQRVQQAQQPPHIDGDLAEEAWRNITWQSFGGENNDQKTRTEYAMVHGKAGLYLAVRCYEPDMQALRMNGNRRDGLFEYFDNDDWLEVLIDPGLTGHDYYWLIVNAKGTRTDLCAIADPDRSWDGQWQVATHRDRQMWTAEFYLPYQMFSRTADIKDEWALQIARRRINTGKSYTTGEADATRTLSGGSHRHPATWPRISGLPVSAMAQAVEVSALQIEPIAGASGQARLTAKVTALPTPPALSTASDTDTAIPLRGVMHVMRPGSAKGLVPHGNGPRQHYVIDTVDLLPGETIELSANIAIDDDEVVIAYLALFDKNTGDLLHCTRDRGMRIAHVVGGPGPQYSLYSTEKQALVQLDLRQWGADHKLISTVMLESGELITQSHTATKPSIKLPIDLEAVPIGRHVLQIEMQTPQHVSWFRQFDLVKASPASESASPVKINRWRQTIVVDDEPFIAIGSSPLITHGLNYARGMMKEMAAQGFNTMHVWGGYLVKGDEAILDPENILKCFDAAEELGLKIILSLPAITQNEPSSPFIKYRISDSERLEIIAELVTLLRDHPALLGYEIGDEPEFFVSPEWLERVYDTIKAQDPWHLVTINNCRGARSTLTFAKASDTSGIDYYPVGKWPAGTIGPLTSEVVDLAGTRPVKTWLQGYKIFNPRAPTPDELVMMTYSAIARGSSSIFYFIGKPPEKLWEAQGQCANEFIQLKQAVIAPIRKQLETQPHDDKVYASFRQDGQHGWIIAVNESDTQANGEIILPAELNGITSSALVLFEDRQLAINQNRLVDTFAPHARHVYKIDLAKKD